MDASGYARRRSPPVDPALTDIDIAPDADGKRQVSSSILYNQDTDTGRLCTC
jgi:hypothetical protein